MKKVGMVGGIGWRSTVDYYEQLCRRCEQEHAARKLPGAPVMPEISIESLDLAKAVSYIGRDSDQSSWARFDAYHREALRRVQASGAELALIASNTPHHRWEAIVQGLEIPVVSILDEVAKESARIGVRRVLLLGTALTMGSARFRQGFAGYGVEARGPRDPGVKSMILELIAKLQAGKPEGAAAQLVQLVKRELREEAGTPNAVCLACTELPLAFEMTRAAPGFQSDGILFLNASAVHVEAVFRLAYGS